MPNLVADLSDYQESSVQFMQALKDGGVKAVIIKLTEDTGWIGSTSAEKIRNAVKVGLIVHCYHYARFWSTDQAVAEADYFCSVAKQYGIDASSVMALDLEEGSNPAFAKTFLDRVIANGYPRIDLYTMASYIWSGKVSLGAFGYKINGWIAAYGASQPGVDNVGTWQFSSNYPIGGYRVDMSYDFSGYYTTEQDATQPEKITTGGWLDVIAFDGNQMTVSGWFGTDQAKDKPHHYVILTADGHELARQKVELADRLDVHTAYPDIDAKCGFSAKFDYTKDMANKKVTVYFRYTDDPEGNGNAADFTADHEFNQNLAYLDGRKSTIYTSKLQLSGWHATDLSIGLKYRFLILLADGKEVQRIKVDSVNRPDVAKSYPGVYGSGQAGFNGEFDYPAARSSNWCPATLMMKAARAAGSITGSQNLKDQPSRP
jgi:GH25 family lysozyme M1 (1,4-beta-N-acetylmuramidase)|nr:MAG TPA: PlyB like endolysin [Caudoviricetes sp.]